MNYQSKQTLAYFQQHPQFRMMDMSQLPVSALSKNTSIFVKSEEGKDSPPLPDTEAVEFYALNHCAAVISNKFTPNEVLNEKSLQIMSMYMNVVATQVQRLTHYMLCIVTREARHLNKTETSKKAAAKHGNTGVEFLNKICGMGKMPAVDMLFDSPPDMTLGAYLTMIEGIFRQGSWSGGFGGKPWAKITDTLLQCVKGKISAEMMVDTAWTLAHNNGPMFNKGMLYRHYTPRMYEVLDIQRAGMVPELFLEEYAHGIEMPEKSAMWIKVFMKEHPNEFQPYLNWLKVKEVSVKGNPYHGQIKAMYKAHPELAPEGYDPSSSLYYDLGPKKVVKKPVPKIEVNDKTFVIANGEYAEMVTREEAYA